MQIYNQWKINGVIWEKLKKADHCPVRLLLNLNPLTELRTEANEWSVDTLPLHCA